MKHESLQIKWESRRNEYSFYTEVAAADILTQH